jgi:Tfp pilus assembly protein PilF
LRTHFPVVFVYYPSFAASRKELVVDFLSAQSILRRNLHHLTRTLTVLLCLLLAVIAVSAQAGIDSVGTGGRHKIQGRIYFPSGRRSDVEQVKVILESTSSDRLSVLADLNGAFTFDGLAPGSYSVVVDAGKEYETAREPVVIEGNGVRGRDLSAADLARTNMARVFNVIVTLRLKPTASTRTGVIDASLANIPKAALDLYQRALESIQAGNRQQAVEQLKTAVSYYPDFALARNELGVQYLRLGMLDKALEVFRAAVAIRPDDLTIRLNYGVALLEKKSFAEAEAQLRQILAKNSDLATAHLYLGIALIRLGQHDDAEQELQRAAALGGDSMSLAHYYLGGIFWRRRQYKLAADELEAYLRLTPKARDAEQVKATIRDLRNKEAASPLENSDLNKVKSVRTPQ